MKIISSLIATLALSLMLGTSAYADEQADQFETGPDHALTPDQVKILKDDLLVKGYTLSFESLGPDKGDKFILAKTLPEGTKEASKLRQIAALGIALMEYPQDQELAKAVEAKAKEFIAQGAKGEEGDPQDPMAVAHGYQMIAVLTQVADIPRVDFRGPNPFVPWAEFMSWAATNDLPKMMTYPGHKWKLSAEGSPMLVMPNGTQSWAKLKEAGIDGPDHKMPADWSYTEKGFKKGKDEPVVEPTESKKPAEQTLEAPK